MFIVNHFRLFFAGIFFLFIHPLNAQRYRFSQISSAQGLPQKYVYDMEQDSDGFLWIGTGEGLCRYDGSEMKIYTHTNHLEENFITKLFKTPQGDLWIGHNQGGITLKRKEKFTGIAKSNAARGPVTGFALLANNYVMVVFQNGHLLITNGKKNTFYNLSDKIPMIYSVTAMGNKAYAFTSEGCLVVTTAMGKLIQHNLQLPELKNERIQAVAHDQQNKNLYWLGSMSGNVYQFILTPDGSPEIVQLTCSTEMNAIQEIVQDREGNLWIATLNGAYYTTPGARESTVLNHYSTLNGMPSNFIKTILQDKEGNTWFGLYGEGMAMLRDEFFTFYQYTAQGSTNDIKSLFIKGNTLWLGMENGLMELDLQTHTKKNFHNRSNGMRTETVVALAYFNNSLVAGTAYGGLYILNSKTKKWKQYNLTDDQLTNQITDIKATHDSLWVGTRGGLFLLDRSFKITRLWDTETGLLHNQVNCIYIDRNQRTWICTPGNQVTLIHHHKLEHIPITKPGQAVEISCMTKDVFGKLWFGTYGSGVIIKNGESLTQLSSADGLHSDYIYSIVAGENDDVWIGHRGALTRINTRSYKTHTFDQQQEIINDFNSLAVIKDSLHNIWFGTNKGLLHFNQKKMRANKIPPKINLKAVLCSDKSLDITQAGVLPYNSYKVKFSFVGISLTKPEDVKYQYFLEGHDLTWSDVSSNGTATYSKLDDGTYTLKVRAFNSEGYSTPAVSLYSLTIRTPFWKQEWFIGICGVSLVFGIMLIIRIRERKKKMMLILLEKKLAIRTSELMKQKQIVEEKNKDITDSINYALRIQNSLLPKPEELKSHLPESFVIYKPRDIVSGDFYWFSRKDEKLILVCADCTGHGVPGAFMSMIGNTLFNDILQEAHASDPAKILYSIDYKIRDMFQHDNEAMNDGMDAIVLRIDLNSGELNFSGAVRPLIHVNGEQVNLYRTSRDSIGGQETAKCFSNYTVQLSKGDQVYMFTDGYTDQFGGPKGKKMHTKGLIQAVKHLQKNPEMNQELFLKDLFDAWKMNEPQADDVLLIGFKY